MSSKKSKSKSGKSPKGKGSKGSKSPKGSAKQEVEVAKVDAQTEADRVTTCLLCLRQFKHWANLQSHLLNMEHDCMEFDHYRCRVCGRYVESKHSEVHPCNNIKAHFMSYLFTPRNLKYGPPNRCLLCKCAAAPSKIHLVLHLLCYHTKHASENKCGMCGDPFDTTEFLDKECGGGGASNSKSGSGKGSKGKDKKSKSPDSSKKKSSEKKSASKKSDNKSPGSGKKGSKGSKGSKEKGSDKTGGSAPMADYTAFNNIISHINQKHQRYLLLETKKRAWHASETRDPFSCPFCNIICQNNAEFHAHIICCHGHKGDMGNKLYACCECDFNVKDMVHLSYHVRLNHQESYQELAREGIKDMTLLESVDSSQVCHMCWGFFNSATELQMHILSKHVGMERFQCGHCRLPFMLAETLDLAYRSFENHVKNHVVEHLDTAKVLQLEFGEGDRTLLPVGVTNEEYCKAKYPPDESKSGEKSRKSKKSDSPKGSKKDSAKGSKKGSSKSPKKK